MPRPLNVLGISGSLRQGSLNTALLRHVVGVASASGLVVETAEIRDLPLYDETLDGEHTPTVVTALKTKIRAADAILFVSPEYNYSIPGGLKNAIDWASRTPSGTPHCLADKPVAIMGVTPGMLGTSRMQYHLRQVCVFLDAHVLNKPEVMIGRGPEKFDADLRLTDETTKGLVKAQLDALAVWTRRLQSV